MQGSPGEWAETAVKAFDKYHADAFVGRGKPGWRHGGLHHSDHSALCPCD